MIPKIIHYCWFGNNKKSDLINKCINSWKKYFPDYEIIEWNENNTNLNENEYIKKAYELKKWAYVSDYIRMKVLYQYGGIYFDVDVEVIKQFPKQLFELQSFSGYESFSGLVSPGLVYACMPGDVLVKKVMDSYKDDIFTLESTEKMFTINKRITKILDEYGYVHENEKQTILGLTIFPDDFFCAYDAEKRCTQITKNTLSVHHYAASWFPWHKRIKFKIGTILRHIKNNIKLKIKV